MRKRKNLHRAKKQTMEVLGEFDPEEILLFVGSGSKEYTDNKGVVWKIKMGSARYKVFNKNKSCVVCGLTGTVMLLEKHHSSKTPHFNLYAIDDKDDMVLMTKDHVVPKSKGGSDCLDNYQTMCFVCNSLKKNHDVSIQTLRGQRKQVR